MSVVKDVYISCDECDVASAWGGEHPSPTVRGARDYAESYGWKHTRDGRDLCPACSTTPQQPAG